MKGSECKFVKFMEGADKRFVIPVYQRNYDWKKENCKQLYDDLVKITKAGRKSHFFGSIVSVFNPDGHHEEFLVIDGQQRLTTVSLLFLAMYNLMDKGVVVPQKSNLKQLIFEEYLVDKWQPEETRIKLKPIKNDQSAYGKLFAESTEYIRESNLTINYNYFYERIQKQEITIDQLFDAIRSLEIINIRLDMEDNPQLIFESLNSTGLDLSEGDKIRNFILMGLPSKEQESYYENYWNKIEEYTKYDVSTFVRDYLSVKQQEIPVQNKVYLVFKDYVEIGSIKTQPLLEDMKAYAKRYAVLLNGKTKQKALDACIKRLNRLGTTVTRPFFLEVLRLLEEKRLTSEQVTEVFLITENYILRRSICDLPTNSLNKIFLMLHREIIRYDGTDENYVEKFKYTLLNKRERARFPSDDEFAAMFSVKPIYLMHSRHKIYILERIENFGTGEDKDIYRHCDEGEYSIEHIMPQHLTPAWQKELGDDYEQIHTEWLHRIANLTLTAYNSKYSNNTYVEKKTMPNGFKDSGIRMNTWIADKDKWTLEELEERSKYLENRALCIWTIPVTDYKPAEKQLDYFTLDDDFDLLKGRTIAKFRYKNTEQPVSSWVEMYQKVLQILFAEDKTIITNLAVAKEEGLAAHFTLSEDYFAKSVEIGDGIHIWTNTNTSSKLSVLSKVFELYGVEPMDLEFYLRDEAEEFEGEVGTSGETRRKYWTYALDVIHQVHGDGLYSGCNPTNRNWIDGFFGIGGINIGCVANWDCAKVVLYLGKSNAQENKKSFDALLAKRIEIESKIGATLVWDRGENVKHSKIVYQLENVSVDNETDWYQMAKFHAEWSKKFYDVIVPYIKACCDPL